MNLLVKNKRRRVRKRAVKNITSLAIRESGVVLLSAIGSRHILSAQTLQRLNTNSVLEEPVLEADRKRLTIRRRYFS